MNPNSFDITTLTGYKLYRLCQTWDTRFGALNQSGEKPRLIQFSLKLGAHSRVAGALNWDADPRTSDQICVNLRLSASRSC